MRKTILVLTSFLLFLSFLSACSAGMSADEVLAEAEPSAETRADTKTPAPSVALPSPDLTIGTATADPTALVLSLTPTSAQEITNEPEAEPAATLETTGEPAVEPTSQADELPEEYYIYNISGHSQYFPLGCEASAAIDWANYFGVVINEFEFQTRLPLSDNPDLGFVGSVESPWGQSPPYGYGVHAYPIADLLNEYGMNAVGVKDYTIEEIKEQVANDQPVIAWVIGNCVGGIPTEYTDSEGNTTIVAAYEHVIIVTGYSEERIRYMNNGSFYEVPVDVFENSWSVLQNMVVYLEMSE